MPTEDQLRQQCESIGFDSLEALSAQCWYYTSLKLISYSVIVAASIIKLPQLVKIIANRSVQGLSRISAYAEFISYFNTMAFARHLKHPISLYGETIMISTQNFIVILFIFWYDGRIALHEKMLFLGLFGMYATVLLADNDSMTEMHWRLVSGSVMLCSAIARASQFCENWKNQSTGQVAGGTVFITFFVAFCRTLVVLCENDDFMYQM